MKKLTKGQIKSLEKLFPKGDCLLSQEECTVFGGDSSGLFALPEAVARPNNEEELVELMRFAQKEQIAVYPRASASNTVGATVPILGGIVVSTTKLDKIIEIDENDFIARAESGVITGILQKEAEKKGLFYPPDPASRDISTIGGNIATCAGGMRAIKYGVTRDYVLGMRVVLAGGKILELGGRCHKDVVGFDLMRLFVGSAGNLGIFSELTVKLLAKPQETATVLVGFSHLEEALKASQKVLLQGITPRAMEFFDAQTIDALKKAGDDIFQNAQAALFIQIDATRENRENELMLIKKVLKNFSCLFIEEAQEEKEKYFWNVRSHISQAAFELAPNKLGMDIVVPRGKIAQAVNAFKLIAEKHSLNIMCFGHIGDGNIHVSVMYDKFNTAENEHAEEAKKEIFQHTLGLSGSISGEHGIGLQKLAFLDKQLGKNEREYMQAVKDLFDPLGILNAGKGW